MDDARELAALERDGFTIHFTGRSGAGSGGEVVPEAPPGRVCLIIRHGETLARGEGVDEAAAGHDALVRFYVLPPELEEGLNQYRVFGYAVIEGGRADYAVDDRREVTIFHPADEAIGLGVSRRDAVRNAPRGGGAHLPRPRHLLGRLSR
jgi:hypothetical protein